MASAKDRPCSGHIQTWAIFLSERRAKEQRIFYAHATPHATETTSRSKLSVETRKTAVRDDLGQKMSKNVDPAKNISDLA